MGLSCISHLTLIKVMKTGYTESWTRLMRQKWGQLHEFQAVTNIKEENPELIPPNNKDLRRPWCTEGEPYKYDENEVTDPKVVERATDTSCANTFPVLKGKHLLLHSPTYAEETTECKTIKKCGTSTTSDNDKHWTYPKTGDIISSDKYRYLLSHYRFGYRTHTHTHTQQNFNRPFTLYLLR
jgi:hypothetical protein